MAPHDSTQTLVLSPHLDDAAFSCGGLLATTKEPIVVTLFAGLPPEGGALPDWDRRCGFRSARSAMLARREEDKKAMQALGAMPVWLEFLDDQYGVRTEPAQLASAIKREIETHRPQRALFPLGLFHRDHLLAHDAATLLHRQFPRVAWLAYEDIPYRRQTGLLQARLSALERSGLILTPIHLGTLAGRKAKAVSCYESQLRALGANGLAEMQSPERFWQVGGS